MFGIFLFLHMFMVMLSFSSSLCSRFINCGAPVSDAVDLYTLMQYFIHCDAVNLHHCDAVAFNTLMH